MVFSAAVHAATTLILLTPLTPLAPLTPLIESQDCQAYCFV